MSSAVARPMRRSSKKLTSSTFGIPPSWSDLFDTARLAPRQVDAQFFGRAEDVLVGVAHFDRGTVARQHFHVQAERLHLLDEHLETFWDARLWDVLALDDRLVHLHAAEDVVGLDGEQFLQGVGGAVGLQGPHLHLTEALPAELRLTAQRLLGDHRVRAGAPRVDLVVHQVEQLEDVDVADRDRVLERLAGPAVEQARLTVRPYQSLTIPVRQRAAEQAGDLLFLGPVEDRGGDRRARGRGVGAHRVQALLPLGLVALDLPAGLGHPPEVGLQDLADVHPARDAERVEHDVHRGAVLEERHVLHRQDLRDHALVPVPAGQLVAVGDLALLGHVHPDQLVHARRQLVAVLAGEHADADDLAFLAVRDLEAGVADLTGLLAEDRAQQPLLGRQLGLALGRDLADQDVAVDDLGADPDDAALVQVGQDLVGDVRDVPGDLLRAQLGVPGVDLVLLDVDAAQHVVLNQPLGQDDGVLVVVALPRHERGQQVLAQRHLAVVGARAVGQHLADLDPVAFLDDRLLVEAGALVGPLELLHAVGGPGAVVVHDGDQVRAGLLDHAGLVGQDHVARVGGGAVLHAGADHRRLGPQQRHRLALHVGAHQRAVGVVVLQERDHGGGHGHHLPRGHVHVVDLVRRDGVHLAALAADQHAVLRDRPVRLQRRVGLRDDVPVLLVGGQVIDLVGHHAVDDLAVRGLHEAERVHPGVARQAADEADVRPFRRLDRAHPAVVAGVHVADLEARPLPGQATEAQGAQPALVGQAGQRVGLVHELGELAGAEELLDGRHHGPDVDQGLRRDRLDVLSGHPLPDHALHPGQAQPDLVLDQLAHGPQPPVAEVVDVVGLQREDLLAGDHLLLAGVQPDQALDGGDDVLLAERALPYRQVQPELAVDLLAD